MKYENSIVKVIIISITWFLLQPSAQPEWSGEKSIWKGYNKYDMTINGRSAYVVEPKAVSEPYHWVLRARFPNWHVDMDVILLEKGVHIAYIDVANLFGSPTAVSHWDSLYQFMIDKGMAKKPAIEGVSRGGLISYNWAKLNPEKIACMYLEGPVCDLKSWPGGKGVGIGSAGDWISAQSAYGMTEEELMAFEDNPIDNLELLAGAKVPLYHKISLVDEVVPTPENTDVLVERYRALGGIAIIDTQTVGPFELNGHHYPISNPEEIAEYMESNLILKNAPQVFISTRKAYLQKPLEYKVFFIGSSIHISNGEVSSLENFYSISGKSAHSSKEF